MSEVFTSYSRRDTELVDHVVEEMKESGLSVWIDREAIKAGNQWRVQIVQAIDTCDAFVLMLSPNSAASENVRKEIDLAQDSGRTIFAMLLEPVKLPAEIRYQLAGLQFVDAQMLGFEKAANQLITTIKEYLKKLKPAAQAAARQVELVIQGIDVSAFGPDKQQQMLDFISKLAETDKSKVKIEKITEGSVHVFMKMPAAAAYLLKTLALNRDARLKQVGITALKLAGNKKYVNVASGQLTQTATVGSLMSLWLKVPALLSSVVGPTVGKLLTIAVSLLVLAGVFTGALIGIDQISVSSTPTVVQLTPTLTPTPTPTATHTPTFTPTGTPTARYTPTYTLTTTNTFAPLWTQTPTPRPTKRPKINTAVVESPIPAPTISTADGG